MLFMHHPLTQTCAHLCSTHQAPTMRPGRSSRLARSRIASILAVAVIVSIIAHVILPLENKRTPLLPRTAKALRATADALDAVVHDISACASSGHLLKTSLTKLSNSCNNHKSSNAATAVARALARTHLTFTVLDAGGGALALASALSQARHSVIAVVDKADAPALCLLVSRATDTARLTIASSVLGGGREKSDAVLGDALLDALEAEPDLVRVHANAGGVRALRGLRLFFKSASRAIVLVEAAKRSERGDRKQLWALMVSELGFRAFRDSAKVDIYFGALRVSGRRYSEIEFITECVSSSSFFMR